MPSAPPNKKTFSHLFNALFRKLILDYQIFLKLFMLSEYVTFYENKKSLLSQDLALPPTGRLCKLAL